MYVYIHIYIALYLGIIQRACPATACETPGDLVTAMILVNKGSWRQPRCRSWILAHLREV